MKICSLEVNNIAKDYLLNADLLQTVLVSLSLYLYHCHITT